MIKLGDYNTLRITRFSDHGAYLDGGELGEILMPKNYVKRNMHLGTEVNVFVYLDQSERLVGTLETPLARVGDFAFLEVAWVVFNCSVVPHIPNSRTLSFIVF